MLCYVYSRVFCAIQELLSGQELPHFSADKLENFLQLLSNDVSDCIPNILWIYFPVLELWDFNFWKVPSFEIPSGVSSNNFFSRNNALFIL